MFTPMSNLALFATIFFGFAPAANFAAFFITHNARIHVAF
jgi:hypothetical protein